MNYRIPIHELDTEIDEIKEQLQSIMENFHSPIMSFRMTAIILAEVSNFAQFDSPDKLLAYAGTSGSTYRSS